MIASLERLLRRSHTRRKQIRVCFVRVDRAQVGHAVGQHPLYNARPHILPANEAGDRERQHHISHDEDE
jgi:hypothetical protein